MAMNSAYLDALADHGGTIITHVGLVDETGTELSGDGYARQPCTWTGSGDGLNQLGADETFSVGAVTVAGWRGYSALTAGTDYGGADLTQEVYAAPGTYTLLAAQTSIDHNAA